MLRLVRLGAVAFLPFLVALKAWAAPSRGAERLRAIRDLIGPADIHRKYFPCTERIVDKSLIKALLRPFCDTDSIRFVAVWPQARQKAVEFALSLLSCLRGVR
jgi:hypothetical protein